jgi:RNA polymerase sigma factor (sigma-70 family)
VKDRAREAALAALVRDHGAELTRYAYAFTGELAAAQDLVQEALVKVFVRTRAGLEIDVLEAYVRRAIATTYVDGYRRARTFDGKRHLSARAESMSGPEVHGPDRLDLHAALGALGRQERTAVVLRYFDDLTVAQVADVMHLAEGTVKRYLANAVRRLEDRLGPLDTPPDHDRDPVLVRPTSDRSR